MAGGVRDEPFRGLASLRSQSDKRQLIQKARQEFMTRPLSTETIVGR